MIKEPPINPLMLVGGIVVDEQAELWLFPHSLRKGSMPWRRFRPRRIAARPRASRSISRWKIGKAASVVVLALRGWRVLGVSASLVPRQSWGRGRGKVIRSAQPTPQLAHLVRDYHIKSILNLRGGGPADWWYERGSADGTRDAAWRFTTALERDSAAEPARAARS